MLAAQQEKIAQVPVSLKIPDARFLLVVDPENVGGYDLHAARLHFEQFGFPAGFVIAGKMEFAHDREPGLSVFRQEKAVGGDRFPAGGGSAKRKLLGSDRETAGIYGSVVHLVWLIPFGLSKVFL